jgi:hypothetical protein
MPGLVPGIHVLFRCHCERSEAIRNIFEQEMDCFVAVLLAMRRKTPSFSFVPSW